MKNSTKFIVGGICFVACIVVGFAVVKQIQNFLKDEVDNSEESALISAPPPSQSEPREMTATISTFHRQKTTRDSIVNESYEVVQHCIMVGDNVAEEWKDTVMVDRNATPKRIDQDLRQEPNPGPEPEPEPEPVRPRMSNGQVQSLLNNLNDDILEGVGNDKISGNLRIRVTGLRSGDVRNALDVRSVRENISMHHWRGVTVVRTDYDQTTGRITGVTIRPIYEEP